MAAWLVKTEPEVYSIQDLKRDKRTRWDLVRNYQARNFLRAMKVGESVVVYHSNSPGAVGAVGIGVVVKEAYPDPSQFDRRSEYFDEKATPETPRWFSPEIAFQRAFPRLVPLDEIASMKEFKSHQLVTRGNRLSVLPLTEVQLRAIERAAD